MASGEVMTHSHDVRTLTMKSDKLSIQGTGITPRPDTPSHDLLLPSGVQPTSPQASSRVSTTSDDDVSQSVDDEEANSMLRGVVTMNQVLEGQIEALRLRLQVEDKQHLEEKSRLRQEKDGVIHGKETEIEDLKDSLLNRDERIQTLVKASQEKDRTIETKVNEIEELKSMVKQTEDYAHKLHRQIGKVRHQKQTLETDSLYQDQNVEIGRLTEEIVELKKRLSGMEQELQRASKVMGEQTRRIQQLEAEKGDMAAQFKQELDKTARAMRQEVERMREVMRQNYDEMRQLRDQNKQMHSDVKDIKELLLRNRVPPTPGYEGGTGLQRPLTASPIHMFKPAEFSNRGQALSRGAGSPQGPGQGVVGTRPVQAIVGSRPGRESSGKIGGDSRGGVLDARASGETSSRISSKAGASGGGGVGGGPVSHNAKQKVDSSARTASKAAAGSSGGGPYSVKQSVEPPVRSSSRLQQNPQQKASKTGGASTPVAKGSFPPICALKDDCGLPSIGASHARGQPNLQRSKSTLRMSTGKGARK